MKTFLLTVALFAAVACAAPKNKRDVSHLLKNAEYLPPNHQHHHEHHYHEANVQQPQYVAPQPQLNNQYLAPVAKAPESQKQSLQVPFATLGMPFKAAPAPAPVAHVHTFEAVHAPVTSYGAPVVHAQPAPQVHYAPAPAPVPHTTYGVPQQHQQHYQPQPQYQQPQPQYQQPQQHYQPQPQYQQPQQQHYHQAPQPVPHQTYGVPVVHRAPAPVVYQAPQPQYSAPAPTFNTAERLVFEAPVPSIEVSQSHSVERVQSAPVISAPVPAPEQTHDTVSIEAIGKSTEVHQYYNQQQVASNGGYVY